ncbi:pleckstrin homology domain-containing family O member 2 isoform X2 [Rhinoderma darwinii]|uniref:pleckstrin homology domain-containing family O member 2 isoform X2 n=1 Tax=Rhinoderma darwinii TaxID=43563 RepID=UPI003F672217
MEDGVKGSSVSPPESNVIHKAGWLKKSSGLLGLWKDRYIQILKTQLHVFDNEQEQRCLETLELANYERCQDQKAFLKRKRHFNLIPSPGNKLKVDNSCSLEHVTRDRVKVGAAKRRPPTRIHLKEVADAAADDSLRLGLEALDTGILTVVPPTPKEKVEDPKPRKEPVKILMPPTKKNNVQTMESAISDTTDNVQVPYVPSPPPKILKENIYAREKLLSENAQKNMENASEHRASNSPGEKNVSNVLSSPPKPPPKILSDKMKIKWVGSSADLMEKENTSVEKGSKENLVDFEDDDPEITSICQTMISSDKKIEEKNKSTSSLQDENEMESHYMDDDQNDIEDIQNKRTTKDTEVEKHVLEENYTMTDNSQESPTEQPVLPLDDTNMSPRLNIREDNRVPAERKLIGGKTKASSMGDLLSDSNIDFGSKGESSMLHLTKDSLSKVEMKLACGRQRTETLLNQVLNGQSETEEDNGFHVNSAALLNEVMRDLQEASEALMEIKVPKNATQEGVTDKQKELLALQRRTVHF